MNIFRVAFEIFLIYLAYRFIFGFVIPIYRTTRQMKQKMADMHEKMNERAAPSNTSFSRDQAVPPVKTYADDYIEY